MKDIIKKLVSLLLNIALLFLSFIFAISLMKSSLNESIRDSIPINIVQSFLIIIQYILIVINQIKYKEKLSTSIIYSNTRLTNLIFITVLLFSGLFVREIFYLTVIYFFITTLLLNLVIRKINKFVIAQILSVILIYVFRNTTMITMIELKSYFM